jgi:hypothetical protein
MHVVLQGSLYHFGTRDLLAFLARSPHEGTFDAEWNGERARLALRGGLVVAAEGAGAPDPAGVVAKLLQWTDGTFTFLDEVVLSEEATPLALDIEALIVEAEMRIAEMRRESELFPDDKVRFRVVNRPPGEINLTAEEFQVLFQIGSGKSLAQLLRDSGRSSADLYPIVQRLSMTGLVETSEDPDATSPRDASALVAASASGSARVPDPARPAPVAAPVAAPAPVSTTTLAPIPAPSPVAPPAPPSLELDLGPPPPPPVPAKTSNVARPPAAGDATERNQAIVVGGPTLNAEAPLVATLTTDDGIMHPLLEETATIGRTPANTIALRDASVSAKHARIVRDAKGFTIEDVGSRNGTFVNGEKLTEKRLLAEGDLVRLGKIILTFNLASDIQRRQSTEREMMK